MEPMEVRNATKEYIVDSIKTNAIFWVQGGVDVVSQDVEVNDRPDYAYPLLLVIKYPSDRMVNTTGIEEFLDTMNEILHRGTTNVYHTPGILNVSIELDIFNSP